MESIGEKLKTRREEKGYSIEQIARDTNIAKRYLQALEDEDFSVFPGDTYLVGFLKNYAEYLGLNAEELATLYKNFKIQEQPLPMDELLVTKPRFSVRWILGIAALVAVLVIGGYFLFPKLFGRDGKSQVSEEKTAEVTQGNVHELVDEMLEKRFSLNDIVVMVLNGNRYNFILSKIADKITLDIPGGTSVLGLGDERAVDVDGDDKMDVKVYLTDIDAAELNPSAVLRFDRFTKTAQVVEAPAAAVTETSATVPEIGVPSAPSREKGPVVVATSESAKSFTISVVFRGYCLFRYAIDASEREERYFYKGETLQLDVENKAMLWISNAGNFIAKVLGNELDIGRPGEVAAKLLQWEKSESSGSYQLQLVHMY